MRRIVVAVVLVVLTLAPAPADAQPSGKPRIGLLGAGNAAVDSRLLSAFRQGLSDMGWIENQTVMIEYRWAGGYPERLPALAQDLVRIKVDVIVATGIVGIRAAKDATSTIPILFVVLNDPVSTGLVKSFARPGGNMTGLASQFEELVTKQLQLVIVDDRVVVAVLWNAANPGNVIKVQVTARTLGVTLQSREVRGPDDFERAFAAITKERPEALLTLDDPLVFQYQTSIVDFAAKRRLPAMHPFRESVEAGGLIAYSVNLAELNRRSAEYVDKILKGAKPADLPVVQSTKFEFVINLRSAKALGLTIPETLLATADELIQ